MNQLLESWIGSHVVISGIQLQPEQLLCVFPVALIKILHCHIGISHGRIEFGMFEGHSISLRVAVQLF